MSPSTDFTGYGIRPCEFDVWPLYTELDFRSLEELINGRPESRLKNQIKAVTGNEKKTKKSLSTKPSSPGTNSPCEVKEP